MDYTPTHWQDFVTGITGDRLNNLEGGVQQAINAADDAAVRATNAEASVQAALENAAQIKGLKGDPGDPGPAGQNGLSLVYRGSWAPNTEYHKLDLVTHDGALYLAPFDFTSDAAWDTNSPFSVVAQRGEQGPLRPLQGTLTIGTVTTLPSGAQATASIEGGADDSPLELNLGVPRGPKGDGSGGSGGGGGAPYSALLSLAQATNANPNTAFAQVNTALTFYLYGCSDPDFDAVKRDGSISFDLFDAENYPLPAGLTLQSVGIVSGTPTETSDDLYAAHSYNDPWPSSTISWTHKPTGSDSVDASGYLSVRWYILPAD